MLCDFQESSTQAKLRRCICIPNSAKSHVLLKKGSLANGLFQLLLFVKKKEHNASNIRTQDLKYSWQVVWEMCHFAHEGCCIAERTRKK
jgi:hypothetical protein